MSSRISLRMAALAAVAGLAACSQPNDPARVWTGRAPAVQAVGMQPAAAPALLADGVRTVASFDNAASAPLMAGTSIAR